VSDPVIRKSTRQIRQLLKFYTEAGYTLDRIAVLLGRKPATLKRHAKVAGVTVPKATRVTREF